MRVSRRRSAPRVARATTVAVAVAGLALSTGCGSPDEGGEPEPAGPQPPPEQTAPADVEVALTEVAIGDSPTAGVAGPDDTLWIAERPGRVRLLTEDGLSDPVLDISEETTTDGERGLLGITFDPDFAHVYISYTDRAGDSAVDEFEVSDGEIQTGTRRSVFSLEQPYANHNGGDLAFGPDGMLYLGLGDGGSGGDPHDHGQDLSTLLGTMVRIDPDGDPYQIPEGNPFVDDPEARDEIWAYGLRNPWRFSFDAETGDLWIADVGQSDREEVNRVAAGEGAGANFGWSRMEGSLNFSGDEPDEHVLPVYEYETGERCSITGGYVYRGEQIPAMQGSYLFSDYCDGGLRMLEVSDGEVTGEVDLGVNAGAVVSFAQGPDRELYVLDLSDAIYRIDPA